MPARRFVLLALCATAASCSTSSNLDRRSLSEGISRTFPGDITTVSAAVDQAVETLPVNILAPVTSGRAHIVRFARERTGTSWGETGRIVVTPLGPETTRVTVAVTSWDPVARTESDYAGQVFRVVHERVAARGAR